MKTKQEIKLSCRETRLVLKARDNIDKPLDWMINPEQVSAINHYLVCNGCKRVGLGKILEKQLTCQEALEIWATKPGALYLYSRVTTLKERLAVEHVWGRSVRGALWIGRSKEPIIDNHFGACLYRSCRSLMGYWAAAPLSLSYDGWEEAAEEIPFLIDVFTIEDWPLENLLNIQTKRMAYLLEALGKGKIPPDCDGVYHDSADIVREVTENIKSLRLLIADQLNIINRATQPPKSR
ncbi:MAG: hypothetical protein HYW70_02000 [Candidatus Nealsonbacteria bacterium]|nr:hypothetical protein [Candidatus Nealsonbacteria bacterium]